MSDIGIVYEFLSLCLSLDISTDNRGILQAIHSFALQTLNLKGTGLYFNEKEQLIFLMTEEKVTPESFKVNQQLVDQLKNNKRFLFSEIDENNTFIDELEKRYGLKWVLLLPLIEDDYFLGILFFYGGRDYNLDSLSFQLLMTIAKYLTIIINKKLLYDRMEQRLAELITLQSVSDFVNSTLDFEKLIDLTLDAIVGLIGLRTCSITVFTDKLFDDIFTRKQRALITTVNQSKEVVINLNEGIYRELTRTKTSISDFTTADQELLNLLPSNEIKLGDKLQFIILPVLKSNELYGSINIFDLTLEHLNTIRNNFLESLANHFSIALQNANLYRKQEDMAKRDGLTNLFNHAYFQNVLSLLIEEKSKMPLSLILIDIDDFKKVNDYYGHLVGDQVLKELSHLLKHYSRDGDLVARYGGEEFVILLPETEREWAINFAERLKKAVAENQMVLDGEIILNITVSMGVAVYQSGWTKEFFINQVDQSLYQAKNDGKNRVVVA